jgi:U3 small nucleolar RNA-associated protein 21
MASSTCADDPPSASPVRPAHLAAARRRVDDSTLLVPYRAVGLVTAGLALSVVQHGGETFVTASLGRTFQIYNCAKLRHVFVGPPLPSGITALGSHEDYTIVACGSSVHVYQRAELLATLTGEHEAPVRHLLTMGSTLVSACAQGLVVAWQLPGGELICQVHAGFTPTALLHPATYLNKVLLGSPSGVMQLWNLRSRARVHEFDRGWNSAITALAQSPALDVVAVGLADGRLFLINLKYDTTLLELRHDDGDAVRSLAFRTDGPAWLVSGAASGALHAWQLEKRARLALRPCAHEGGVASLLFLRGKPELLSAGASDNSIRMWSCDAHSGEMGLLRQRSGHALPPSCVQFHDDELHVGGGPGGQAQLLSAGADRTLRLQSIWSAQQDCELSQKREAAKRSMHEAEPRARLLPPLLQMASSQRRERDWANLITCHAGSPAAFCWDTTAKTLAPHTLPARPAAAVTAVAISACGNFGFVGSELGAIDKYNLQSGHHRASAPAAHRHRGAVRGLAAASDGRCLFSCGSDGSVRRWVPATLVLLSTSDLGCGCGLLRHKRDSMMLALGCDDLSVRVVDTVGCKPVRRFDGHTNTLTDLAWGADARWLLSVALDRTLRIVDVPSGALVGWYSFEYAATSLCVSPGGEFVATSHVDSAAICVWASRVAFQDVLLGEVTATRPAPLQLPTALGGDGGDESDDEESEASDDGEEEAEGESEGEEESVDRRALASLPQPEAQVHPQLFTLSKLPASHISTLLHLDAINERNRPTEPIKKPELAPFFLPTLDGVDRTFVNPGKPEGTPKLPAAAVALLASARAPEEEEEEEGGGPKAKRARARQLQQQGLGAHSTLCALLRAAEPHLTPGEGGEAGGTGDEATGDEARDSPAAAAAVAAVSEYLLSLGSSSLDLEARAVGEEPGGRTLGLMLRYLLRQLRTRRDIELVQALLQLLLRLHSEALASAPALLPALLALRREQKAGWDELQEPIHSNLCLLAFMSNCAS